MSRGLCWQARKWDVPWKPVQPTFARVDRRVACRESQLCAVPTTHRRVCPSDTQRPEQDDLIVGVLSRVSSKLIGGTAPL